MYNICNRILYIFYRGGIICLSPGGFEISSLLFVCHPHVSRKPRFVFFCCQYRAFTRYCTVAEFASLHLVCARVPHSTIIQDFRGEQERLSNCILAFTWKCYMDTAQKYCEKLFRSFIYCFLYSFKDNKILILLSFYYLLLGFLIINLYIHNNSRYCKAYVKIKR